MRRRVVGCKYSMLTKVAKKTEIRTSTAEKICRCFCTSGSDSAFYILRKIVKIKFFLQRHWLFTIFSPFIFSFLINIGVSSPVAKMTARFS